MQRREKVLLTASIFEALPLFFAATASSHTTITLVQTANHMLDQVGLVTFVTKKIEDKLVHICQSILSCIWQSLSEQRQKSPFVD